MTEEEQQSKLGIILNGGNALSQESLTPKRIVERLDAHIVGQDLAKRAVAIAIRNRWRRQQIPPEMREEVAPKNIIMIGPTGVGKTEIARRLASLTGAPFVKVEASKYTEVGYHGRDVESMIRDLVKVSLNQAQRRATETVRDRARANAVERVLDALLPTPSYYSEVSETDKDREKEQNLNQRTRDKLRRKLLKGELDDREIEIVVQSSGMPVAGVFGTMGGDEIGMELQETLERMLPSKTKVRKTTVREALRIFESEEADKLIDHDSVNDEAIRHAENYGIVFIDEIDKVVGSHRGEGPDVSREGVQRDLLPLVEGSQVMTRYGMVKTDHILFIAAGAFHNAKPSDLLPELQGRFPIRVELNDLTENDFVRILTEPRNSLVKQYTALLAPDGITLTFTDAAIKRMAYMAYNANRKSQNIGARRLYTVVERLLEDISFDAPDCGKKEYVVDEAMVDHSLAALMEDEDLAKYIL